MVTTASSGTTPTQAMAERLWNRKPRMAELEAAMSQVKGIVDDAGEALISKFGREDLSSSGKKKTGRGDSDDSVTVSVVGSYLLRTCWIDELRSDEVSKEPVTVDLAVGIPFSQKDVQSGKYLQLRAEATEVLLKHLRRHLPVAGNETEPSTTATPVGTPVQRPVASPHNKAQKKDSVFTGVVLRHSFAGDPLKTDIMIHGHGGRFAFNIRIFVRPTSLLASVSSAAAVKKHPYYCYSVMEDYAAPLILEEVHKMVQASPAVAEALVSLKAWASHEGLLDADLALNGFHLTVMLHQLVKQHVIQVGAVGGDAAILRSFWSQVANGKFLDNPDKQLFDGCFCVEGVVSALPYYNPLFRLSVDFMRELMSAATKALKIKSLPVYLSTTPRLTLPMLFDITAAARVDALQALGVDRKQYSRFLAEERLRISEAGKDDLPSHLQELANIKMLATQAMRGRSKRVVVLRQQGSGINYGFLACVTLQDEVSARSRVIKGPPIEDEEAVEAFDRFWGKTDAVIHSRQFQDGAVYRVVLLDNAEEEAVDSKGMSTKAGAISGSVEACERAIKLAATHAALTPFSSVVILGSDVERAVYQWGPNGWANIAPDLFHRVRRSFSGLREAVFRAASKGLPCNIVGCDPIEGAVLGLSVYATKPHYSLLESVEDSDRGLVSTSPTVVPINVILTIDDKRKVPDHREAIKKMKTAVVAQLGRLVESDESSARFICFCAHGHVDVCDTTSGFVFRLHIAHYREVGILRVLGMDQEAALLERKMFWSTKHSQFMQSLADTSPTFALGVRICKRWVSAMHLAQYIPDEVVELIAAYTHVASAASNQRPLTAHKYFTQFLLVASTHLWQREPLIFPDAPDGTDVTEKSIRKSRDQDVAMWIAAPYAPTQSPFTMSTPRANILERFVSLAATALERISREAMSVKHCLSAAAGEDSETTAGFVGMSSVLRLLPTCYDFAVPVSWDCITHPDQCIEPPFPTVDAFAMNNLPMAMENRIPPYFVQMRRLFSIASFQQNSKGGHRKTAAQRLTDQQREEMASYMMRLIAPDPVTALVGSLRAALRNECMVFYDHIGPSTLYIAALGSKRVFSTELFAYCRRRVLTIMSSNTNGSSPRLQQQHSPAMASAASVVTKLLDKTQAVVQGMGRVGVIVVDEGNVFSGICYDARDLLVKASKQRADEKQGNVGERREKRTGKSQGKSPKMENGSADVDVDELEQLPPPAEVQAKKGGKKGKTTQPAESAASAGGKKKRPRQ